MFLIKLSLIFCLTFLNSIVHSQSDENAKGGGRGDY